MSVIGSRPSHSIAPARLVYLDARIAVVDKPAGLSLATPQREPEAAVERLRAALSRAEREQIGEGTLWLVHRLDVGTTGLVVVARDAEMHRLLVAAFGARRVEKAYLALVWGRPRPRQGVWESALAPDRSDRRRMRVDPSGRPATTAWSVLAVGPGLALVELRPATGRTHQIRVHLAAAGHPIVGDDLYGGPRHRGVRDAALRRLLDPGHPLLHAWRLVLPAPPLEAPLSLLAAWPEEVVAVARRLGWEELLHSALDSAIHREFPSQPALPPSL